MSIFDMPDLNHQSVKPERPESAFGKDSSSSGAWRIHKFDDHGQAKYFDDIKSEPPNHVSSGKGAKEGFYIFVPSITKDTFLHLSVRGGSYKIRNYHRHGAKVSPPTLLVPGHRSFDALQSSGVVLRWIPITTEDSTHNLVKEPAYWFNRIERINSQELTAQ